VAVDLSKWVCLTRNLFTGIRNVSCRIPVQGLLSSCRRREWIDRDADPLAWVDRHRPKQETIRATNFEDLQGVVVAAERGVAGENAARLFKDHSGGWTLHQLRHSLLTDLAAMGANSAQLQAKSRHRNRSVLQTYTTLGDTAVSELMGWFDRPPGGRRR